MKLSNKSLVSCSAALIVASLAIMSLARSEDKANGLEGTLAAHLAARFNELDIDKNQKLSRDELELKLFEFLNADGNDSVTLSEAKEVVQKQGFEALQAVANGQKQKANEGIATRPATPVRQGPVRLVAGDHGIGSMIADLKLTDIDNKMFSLSDFKDDKAIVIAFTNTSCPICKKYAPTLAAIEDKYSEKGVSFVFVNSTASDKIDAIRSVIAANGLDGRYVRDEAATVARTIGATRTTDVFVLDAKRTMVYRGAVDDQYGFGYSIDEPRTQYLCKAIDATLANEPVSIAATQAPGCPLEIADANSASIDTTTYHNRVSRILQNHCVQCHRDGGVGPFALQDYDSVVSQSGAIRRVIEEDIMPPWFAAKPSGGDASPFINDCSLGSVDRKILLSWLSGGKAEGDVADAPLSRSFTSGWQIGEPDLVLQLPEAIAIKASGTMPYQNIIVETGFTEDRYVKAVEVIPTARDVVHHCLVFVLPPANGDKRPRDDRAGDDERDGFFAAYAPGYDALVFNDGFGKVIPAGSRLKFQLHYTPNGTATTDQSMIGFVFSDQEPTHLVNVAGISQPRLAIPPHAENFEVNASITVPKDAMILAFFPHMHLRGKAFHYEATTPDGKTQTLLDIPRYDFNWQLSYRLAEPLLLPAGSIIRATAWYDNSKNNPANPDPDRTVTWGPQTYDEMMIGYVEYHMDGGKVDRLANAPGLAALRDLGTGKNIEAMFKQLDKNSDGELSEDEFPKGQKAKLLRFDTDGNGAISMKEAEPLTQFLNRK